MKTLFRQIAWKSWITFLFALFLQIVLWGQDSTGSSSTTRTTSTTTTSRTEWYTAPWVWVVGGAVLIILLVAILSGGRSSSRTTVTKTNDYGTGTTRVRTTEVEED